MTCGILVPHPGTEPMPTSVGAQSLNHWIAKEVPCINFKKKNKKTTTKLKKCDIEKKLSV